MYFVYILSNQRHTVFYTGVTNDIEQRVFDHKGRLNKSFASKYNCDCLVYYEEFGIIDEAIAREKQLKRYPREWKQNLINQLNPDWKDLSEDWYDVRAIQLAIKLNKNK